MKRTPQQPKKILTYFILYINAKQLHNRKSIEKAIWYNKETIIFFALCFMGDFFSLLNPIYFLETNMHHTRLKQNDRYTLRVMINVERRE